MGKKNFSYTVTYTPAQIYGVTTEECEKRVPLGFTIVDFDIPGEYETWLSQKWNAVSALRGKVLPFTPRFVLRPVSELESVYGTQLDLPDGWAAVDFREPKSGDFWWEKSSWSTNGGYVERYLSNHTGGPRVILALKYAAQVPFYTITTVKDIYETENPKIPDGWVVETFGIPKKGQWYLTQLTGSPARALFSTYEKPFLILRQIHEAVRHLNK